MRPRAALLLPLLLVAPAGCRGRSDLVEAQLRSRERELAELKGELYQLKSATQALERGFVEQNLGHPPPPPLPPPVVGQLMPAPPPPPEVHPGAPLATPTGAAPDFLLKDVTVGRPTGGLDEDGKPGDEAVRVTVVPRDVDGHAVKAPGHVQVSLASITPDGLKLPLDAFDVGPTQLRSSWRAALLGSGYQLTFPLKDPPAYDKLRVVVRFTTPGGRTFEAERDVTLRPGTALPTPMSPVAPPLVAPPTVVTPPAAVTPPPAKSEPLPPPKGAAEPPPPPEPPPSDTGPALPVAPVKVGKPDTDVRPTVSLLPPVSVQPGD
jgi:hypothetical protein